MKKALFILLCLMATSVGIAQDKKIAIASAYASSNEPGFDAEYAVDGKAHTYWINSWNNGPTTSWPVKLTITLKEASHVDYVRYIPRKDAYLNEGNWNEVYIAYCPTTTGNDFKNIGAYYLNESSNSSDLWLTENGVTCGQIQFTLRQGGFYKVAATEIEAYAVDNTRNDLFDQYFSDAIFSKLKPEVSSSDGIEDEVIKTLVDNLLTDAKGYSKFRVGEYEAYLPTGTLQNRLKTSSCYNNYENPTGIYLKEGESCLVAVDGIDTNYPVKLTIKNWVTNENYTSYPLRNGLNYITANSEGNVFVNYYTDDFEKAPNVKVHFINAPVLGYWDQATMTNEDWKELLKGRSASDNTILITRSEHAQLAYPISAWLKYCPTNVDSTMTLYQQVQWAQRDILGLERYGRQVKNRQLFYATTYGFMAAGGEGSYCEVNSLEAIMVPDAKRFDFWGVGHEWGHNNQETTGFKWSGCTETTNNIFASWGQIHFTGNPHYLRLEDEVTGIGEYSGMRGGRMQTYFEEGVRKGVPWQLQDGPDYHNAKPDTINVVGYNANGNFTGYMVTTTKRNYDHFVKLSPFWQLNLWGTLAGKCPDIIPMVIESIRSTSNYSTQYNTNGKKQINWMKLACDSAKIDLLPFFEKAGMLRPINAYIEDYNPGWNIINETMIDNLKAHVKEQGYPAFTEEINYINGHNYHIYRDCLELEVPEEIGLGCKMEGNKVKVQHSVVKNAVAFETYNTKGELLRITMYGLGSDDLHSYTQVLYPTNKDVNLSSAYIMAVGYDGTRIKIYEEGGLKEEFNNYFEKAKKYAERVDATGTKIGFLKPEYIDEHISLIERIDSLLKHTDTRERPYGKWAAELKESNEALINYCNPMIPDRYYTIATSSNTYNYLGNSSNGITTYNYQEAEKPKSFKWKFIQSETQGIYYIQQLTTGHYSTSAKSGLRIEANSRDISKAETFTVELVAPGEFYIQCADEQNKRLHNSGGIIYGNNQTDDNAKWLLQMEDELGGEDMLVLPDTSTNEQLVIYNLIHTDYGEYARNSTEPRSKGRITAGIYETPNDDNYWFYFKQVSQDNKYTIYSYSTGKAITKSGSKLYTNKDAEALEVTISLEEENIGFTISTDEGDWYLKTNSSVEISSENRATWRLQRVRSISLVNEPLTSLTLNITDATIKVGESISLIAETAPTFATNHTITWSSSDESIAIIDANGTIKALAEGSAIITATANDGSGLVATCHLTVEKTDTDIHAVMGTTPSVYYAEGIITINGLAEGCIVNVYDIVGKKLATATVQSNSTSINIDSFRGKVAIVTAGTYCTKVFITQ